MFYPDYLTHLIAVQTKDLLHVFGYNAQILPHLEEPSMVLSLNGTGLARIVEGCNGISVIILFLSFIVAFSGKLKTTLFYAFSGSVLIYVVNLIRIALLTIGLYNFPKYGNVLHTIVFPAIIYGIVFLLWIFWVNRFSKLNKNNA